MKTTLIILLLGLCEFKIENKPSCEKIDIILLADLSGSVQGYTKYVHDALYEFVSRFEMEDDGIRICLIRFDDFATVLYPLGSNKAKLIQAIHTISSHSPNGGTEMKYAFRSSGQQFVDNGRFGVKRIVVLISDGATDNIPEAIHEAKIVKNLYNSLIFGVMIESKYSNEEIMKEISSPGCYLESNYENLIEELNRINVCL